MAGLPRILYGMAIDGALPRCFAYLHPRFKTPVVGIVAAAIVPIFHAWLINGNLDSILHLVLAATCAWGTAYLLVTASVVMLRIRRPDLPRPYRSPLFPLPQIVSSVGIILAIWYITPPGMNARDIYVPFGAMLAHRAVRAVLDARRAASASVRRCRSRKCCATSTSHREARARLARAPDARRPATGPARSPHACWPIWAPSGMPMALAA